ncbi:MAG: hypothetical protein U7123_01850 [Potamolinea sp.]
MSEDEQKQPESVNSESQEQPTPSVADQTTTQGQKTSKTAATTRKPSQPFLKAQSIKILRGTIGLLEGVVENLEAELVAKPVATKTVATKISDTTTTTPKVDSVSSVGEAIASTTTSDTPTVTPKPTTQELTQKHFSETAKPKLTDRILPSFPAVEAFWDGTLQKVRSLLPTAWSEKLSDWALTGAIATIVVLLLVTTATMLPETPAQVAKAPPNSIEAPPELTAPEPPEPVEEVPPPEPELTPEQSLIAGIQNQVSEITEKYGNGLIESIQANFEASRLVIKVSNGWYYLKEAQQNKLADEILRRSSELDFIKLEITDSNGTLLARNPVVGKNMIILKREDVAANL